MNELVYAASALSTVSQHRTLSVCYMKLNMTFKYMCATKCFLRIKHCVCFFMEIAFLDFKQNCIEKCYTDFII